MKKIMIILTLMALPLSLFANSKTTISCKGEKVILSEKVTDLGDASQTLFILHSLDSKYVALFLDVDLEADVDSHSMIYTYGKNEKAGQFVLKTKFWQAIKDGNLNQEVTSGLLTYSHGPLVGTDEPVKCIKE